MTIIPPLYLISKIYTALSMNGIQSGPENNLCALHSPSTFHNELTDIACLKLLAFHCKSILMVNNRFNL